MLKTTQLSINQHIGHNLRKMRYSRFLSQGTVARIIGKDRMCISLIENAKQRVTVTMLTQLCSIYRCTPNDIIPEVIRSEGDWQIKERIY